MFRTNCIRCVRDTESFFNDFENKFSSILSFDKNYNENEDEILQITQKLSDMKDVGKLQAKLTEYENYRRHLQSKHSDLDRKKGAEETNRNRMETKRHELVLKDKNNRQIERYKAYAQYLFDYISAEYSKEESRVIQELSKTIDKIFRAIYNGGFSLTLDSKYNVQVNAIGHEGYSEDIETSTAQSISIILPV